MRGTPLPVWLVAGVGVLDSRATGRHGGHLTWLFTVESDAEDPVLQGSRGAGVCIDAGLTLHCTATISVDGRTGITANLRGGDADPVLGRLYGEVIRQSVGCSDAVNGRDWHFEVVPDLPMSQGFGLSAAGAIAAARCVLQIAGTTGEIDPEGAACAIAHLVERRLSGGLGDVSGLSVGGVERRLAPGAPHHMDPTSIRAASLLSGPGRAEGFSADAPVVLCWRGAAAHHTSEYIDDADWQVRIRNAGSRCMDSLGRGEWDASRWSELLDRSEWFAEQSGLLADSMRADLLSIAKRSIDSTGAPARAMLCMLGESISIVPDRLDADHSWAAAVIEALRDAGLTVLQTGIAPAVSRPKPE